MSVRRVKKRDGRIEAFDPSRIQRAIAAAERALGRAGESQAPALADAVASILEASGDTAPSVERIQDVVESVLIDAKDHDLAKAYILYRRAHKEMRLAKAALGVHDDMKLSLNAVRVLERRYLRKDAEGRVVETPTEMFRRVARAVAQADANYGLNPEDTAEAFFRVMASLEFLPNSPTLMNAGTRMGQLSACFVLPVEDSIEGIFETLREMAMIHQSGGGTGFNFSKLRPRGSIVKSSGGESTGPVPFIDVFDKATDVIKQAGRRRGANMAIVDIDHPDVIEFVRAKESLERLTNFNISVAVTDEFMDAVRRDGAYALKNPATGEAVGQRKAREVFSAVAEAAWRCGDPGLVFLDAIARGNPMGENAPMNATNPCGEQPLVPYESCNLGSLNLLKFVEGETLDWERLGRTVHTAVHFLDNVIDVNRYPVEAIAAATRRTRKIGLGVMGFADTLYRLELRYDSPQALEFADQAMRFIVRRAREASVALAEERGSFPAISESFWPAKGYPKLRNCTVTTVAPTGTISLIAGVSSGIEPVFALRHWRLMSEGARLVETHPEFLARATAIGMSEEEAVSLCPATGSIQGRPEFPKAMRQVLAVARDIGYEGHVRMQSVFQRHVDNGVSKTINLPREATVDLIGDAFLLAHRLGCKGVTVYREGCRREDLLHAGEPLDEAASCGLSGSRVCE